MTGHRAGILRLLILAVAALVVAAPAAHGEGEPGASPVKILLAMKRAYSSCRSYRDTGLVKTTSVTDENSSFGSEQPFATVFVRPGHIRFQFTDTGLGERSSLYIVWSDGTEVRSWWDAKPGVRRPASIQEALEVATGISGGSSVRVPGLLMPDQVPEGAPLITPERIDDGDDRGVPCTRVRGKSRQTPYTIKMGARTVTVQDETVTLWIDHSTSLLRRVEETRTYTDYRSQSTTTYTPEIDVEITPSQLAFNPPEPK
jgi:hypothetical protein